MINDDVFDVLFIDLHAVFKQPVKLRAFAYPAWLVVL